MRVRNRKKIEIEREREREILKILKTETSGWLFLETVKYGQKKVGCRTGARWRFRQ